MRKEAGRRGGEGGGAKYVFICVCMQGQGALKALEKHSVLGARRPGKGCCGQGV